MANRYYQSFRVPFVRRVFWRRISEAKFRARIEPFASPGTLLDDLVSMMGASRSIVLTDDKGRSYRCVATSRRQSNALTHHQ